MSSESIEVVRGFFEAMSRGEPFELGHEELVYVEDPKWPGSDVYRGRDAVAECWAQYVEVLGDEITVTLRELRGVGDQVLAIVEVAGRSRETGIPFDHTWGYRCRTRDGRLSYLRAYFDPAEAVAEAG